MIDKRKDVFGDETLKNNLFSSGDFLPDIFPRVTEINTIDATKIDHDTLSPTELNFFVEFDSECLRDQLFSEPLLMENNYTDISDYVPTSQGMNTLSRANVSSSGAGALNVSTHPGPETSEGWQQDDWYENRVDQNVLDDFLRMTVPTLTSDAIDVDDVDRELCMIERPFDDNIKTSESQRGWSNNQSTKVFPQSSASTESRNIPVNDVTYISLSTISSVPISMPGNTSNDQSLPVLVTGTKQEAGTSNHETQSHSTVFDMDKTPVSVGRKRFSSGMTNSTTTNSDSEESDEDNSSDDDDDDAADDVFDHAQEYVNQGCKVKPYFWQYNAQNRGPKGRRLQAAIELKNPHCLDEFVDPVDGRSSNQTEGTDPSPSPSKLLDIGRRIKRFEAEFKSLSVQQTVSKTDINRQKNKLASRICRLKRKAQHEANKIKLSGLREEHRQLQSVLVDISDVLPKQLCSQGTELRPVYMCPHQAVPESTYSGKQKSAPVSTGQRGHQVSGVPASSPSLIPAGGWPLPCRVKEESTEECLIEESDQRSRQSYSSYLTSLMRQNLKYMIAGHTSEFVNAELKKVALHILKSQPHNTSSRTS